MAFALPQQQAIAFWAVKTAALYQAAMSKFSPTPPIPADTWAWLYEHRTDRVPPPGSHVWFGKCDPVNPPEDADRFRVSNTIPAHLNYDRPEVDGEAPLLHYFHTFTIGYLAVQVFGQHFRSDHRAESGRPLAVMLPPVRIEPFQVRIWPQPDQVVVWPPRETIGNREISDFAGWVSALSYYLVGLGSSQRVMLAESDNRARFGSL
jgi:hypothetical protein